MESILEGLYSTNNKLLCETVNQDNLTAEQAINYIENTSIILVNKINNFIIENKTKQNIKNITFSVGSFDVFADFEIWDEKELKQAIEIIATARHNLLRAEL
jgi:hypothetical protein